MRRRVMLLAPFVLFLFWAAAATAVMVSRTQAPPTDVFDMRPAASASATLRVSTSPVSVKRGDVAWEEVVGEDVIREGDAVRTGPLGRAEVVLGEAGTMNLDEETEVTLVMLAVRQTRIFQTIGNTYSKVRKFFDPQALYEVETPTAVAAVRGTQFGVLVELAGITRVVVAADVVTVTPVGVVAGMRERLPAVAVLPEGQGTRIDATVIHRAQEEGIPPPAVFNETLMTPKTKRWFEENRAKDEELEPVGREQTLGVAASPSSEAAVIKSTENARSPATLPSPSPHPTLPVSLPHTLNAFLEVPRPDESVGNTIPSNPATVGGPSQADDSPGRKLLEQLLPIQSLLHPAILPSPTETKHEEEENKEKEKEKHEEKEEKGHKKEKD